MGIAAFSSRGRRDSNQDRALALSTRVAAADAVVLAVADGIGGLSGGEDAAAIAVAAIERFALDVLPTLPARPAAIGAGLARAFTSASEAIWSWGRAHPARGPAGCTLTVAVAWDRRYVLAHAGDTRGYHVGGRGACALTEDHTEAQRLARARRLPPALASASPLRHRLTNALGWPAALCVDLIPPDGTSGALDDGDVLLVCSDGVHDALGEADLAEVAHDAVEAASAAERLVALAFERGALDNASVAIARFGARPAGREATSQTRVPASAARLTWPEPRP